ncbi:hypothetical protein LSAT2_015314 [Lamellibrachia satsuma]|nr:hypothetical protein LSAT2_015314 [Lamellibrachia satsuma]
MAPLRPSRSRDEGKGTYTYYGLSCRYRRAISAPNKVMVSPPVLDQMGAGFLITLSKALTTEVTVRKGFPKRQRVLGVMAISITVEYFDTMLKETFHLCKLEGFICFVIDESGYIIVHRHFVIPPTNIPNIPWIENVHITNKEPEIAKHLIQNHYMLNKSCVDLDYQRRHTTYRIQENASLIDNVNADPTFYMERLPGTNMFLVVRTTTLEVPHSCLCESQYGSVTGECNKNRHVACKCPCYTETDRVVMCDDKSVFSYASDWKPCTPLEQTTENSLTDLIDAEEKGHRLLLTCFEYHCAARKNETQCHVYVGCRWCTHNKDGNMLQSPFCTNYFSCYYGRKGFGSPYRAPKNPFLLTNIIIATIVVMLVVTAGLVAYCQNKIEAQRRNSLEDIANKLKYLSEARGKGKHHGPYTDKELKAWQRRKKRLEKAARRKQQKELKEAKKDQSKDQKEAEATPAENIQQMMLSRFQNGIPDKEQCKQQ